MQITHRQVEAFRAVVHTGTTVDAAPLLHTFQPSISRLIRELEAAVHLKLFDRVKGRLLLTAEGSAFHDEVRRSFAGLQRLSEVAAGLLSKIPAPAVEGAVGATTTSPAVRSDRGYETRGRPAASNFVSTSAGCFTLARKIMAAIAYGL